MRLLVTGATGFIGEAITRQAVAHGDQVTIVVRDAAKAARVFGELPVETLAAPGLDRVALERACTPADLIVHAAAVYSYRRADAQRMILGNPELSDAVFGAAQAAGVPHVVDVSTAGVFKPHATGSRAGITDVASPRWAPGDRQWNDAYLRSKVLAEEVALRYRTRGLPVSSIHPTNVIGPMDRGPGTSGSIIVDLLGMPVYPEGALAWVDVRDVAAGVLAVAQQPAGGRYIFTLGTKPFSESARIIDRVTGRSRRRLFLPRALTTAAATLNDGLGGRLSAALPPRDSVEFMVSLGPVDGAGALGRLGVPDRPFETSIGDAIRWWAENGVVPRALAGRLGR